MIRSTKHLKIIVDFIYEYRRLFLPLMVFTSINATLFQSLFDNTSIFDRLWYAAALTSPINITLAFIFQFIFKKKLNPDLFPFIIIGFVVSVVFFTIALKELLAIPFVPAN